MWKLRKFTLTVLWQNHWIFFSSNQLFSNFFNKSVDLTKFLPNKIQNPFEVLDHEMKFRLDVLNIFLMTFLNFMSLEKFSVLNDHDTPEISELWFPQMIWIYKNFTMIYWNSLIFIQKMLNSACYGEYDFLLRFRSFMNFTMFIENLWFCLRKFSSYDGNY